MIIDDNKNYKKEFEALSIFDRIVSDGIFFEENGKDSTDLMFELMDPSSSLVVDQYVQDIVKSYIRRKKKITINLNGLEPIQEEISGLVIEDKIEAEDTTKSSWDSNCLSSRSNLLSTKIFTFLPNISQIVIKTDADSDAADSYPFNMFHVLEIINVISTWQMIKIEQVMCGEENENKSWLYKLWNSETRQRIIDEYTKYNLNIYFDKKIAKTQFHLSFESLIIVRQFD